MRGAPGATPAPRFVTILLALVAVVLVGPAARAADTPLHYGGYYVCPTERIAVLSCCCNDAPDDMCTVTYPDRPLQRGFTVPRSERRGDVQQRLATCQAPRRISTTAAPGSTARALAAVSGWYRTVTAWLRAETGDIDTIALLGGLAIYFAPTVVAELRGQHHTRWLVKANALIAWTVIGWFAMWVYVVRDINFNGRRLLPRSVPPPGGARNDPARWTQIVPGMWDSEVRVLLGEPDRIERAGLWRRTWIYGNRQVDFPMQGGHMTRWP